MGKNEAVTKNKKSSRVLYFFAVLFVALSILFTVINATLIFTGFAPAPEFLLFPAFVAFVTGLVSWVSARALRKSFLFLFSTVFSFLTSALFFFSAMFPIYGVFWPVLVFFCGISFFFAGVVKKRRFLNFYTVLSGAFLLLGGVFLLFSSKIIPFSFASVFIYVFPPFVLVFIAAVSAVLNSRGEKRIGAGVPPTADGRMEQAEEKNACGRIGRKDF